MSQSPCQLLPRPGLWTQLAPIVPATLWPPWLQGRVTDVSVGASSHHFVHGHPQPTGTDPLPNRPYESCCRGNEDETACVGEGGEKSAGADQSIANASTESRENEMGTIMAS